MIRAANFAAVLAAATAFAMPSHPQEAGGRPSAPSAAVPAQAAEAPAPGERNARSVFADAPFVFHRIEDGYLRLDMQTGEVSACRPGAAAWACVLVADERVARDGEIARLRRENARLRNALLDHGVPLPSGVAAISLPAAETPSTPAGLSAAPPKTPEAAAPPVASTAPSAPKADEAARSSREDAALDRMMTAMEKVWRRLVAAMADIQRDMRKM